MANKGYVQTTLYKNMRQRVDWTATVNKSSRTATIKWTASTVWSGSSSIVYHLCHHPQYIKVNGKTVATWGMFYKHTGGSTTKLTYNDSNHIYNAFTKPDSKLANSYNGKNYHDDPVKYGDKGIPRWVHILGNNHHSGEFTLKYDVNGDASFTLDCNFAWHEDSRIKASGTFHLDNIGKEKHTVTFNKNMDEYPVTNLPSNIKNIPYGNSITIPPAAECEAYNFVSWGGSLPGSSKKIVEDITISAVWSRKSYNWNFYLMDGSLLTSTTHLYDVPTLMPNTSPQEDEDWYTYKWDGEYLRNSYCNINTSKAFMLRRQGVPVSLTIHTNGGKYVDGSTSRVCNVRYNNWDYFENSYYDLSQYYPERVGAEFRGFSKTPHSPITRNESMPTDTVYDTEVKDNTLLNEYIKSGGVNLYAVWEYTSTVYIYTDNHWNLSIPYVYTNGKWVQSLGYVYYGIWKQ